jgi:hypothetical protein
VTGEWRKLHNEELRDLYSSPSIIIRIIKLRRMKWAGHVARMREKRNAYRLLVGKPEGKRPLGRPRRRWVDNALPYCNINCNMKKEASLPHPVLGWISERWDGVMWTGLVWLRIGTGGELL